MSRLALALVTAVIGGSLAGCGATRSAIAYE